MRLLIEMTPPTPTPQRKPRETDLRYYRGPFPESFLPLQPSGAQYVALGALFPVATGQRYGLRLRGSYGDAGARPLFILLLRCLCASATRIAHAAATFSESTFGRIGIFTSSSHRSRTLSCIPLASLPITSARAPVRSAS